VLCYAAWRSSLKQHKDQVTKSNALWEIRTSSEDDVVRRASLEVRVADFHTAKLTLDFADNEKVGISEDNDPLPVSSARDLAANQIQQTPQYLDNPADLLEVHAWTRLHQLKADSGWEGVVLREGAEVRVKAIVQGDSRKQELERGFAVYPELVLDIRSYVERGVVSDVLPNRTPGAEDAPALAINWLRQEFVDVDARGGIQQSGAPFFSGDSWSLLYVG
jgi:hypothetical protein